MRFLDFIEEEGSAAVAFVESLGDPSGFVGRDAEEEREAFAGLILGHVEAKEMTWTEELLGELLGQFGFSDTGGSEEEKARFGSSG